MGAALNRHSLVAGERDCLGSHPLLFLCVSERASAEIDNAAGRLLDRNWPCRTQVVTGIHSCNTLERVC
jgi:hypothetical protein